MIGGIVGRYLDVSEARREAEVWERNYNKLLQDLAEEKGRRRRLEKELKEARSRNADLTLAVDGETRRLVAENAAHRQRSAEIFERAVRVAEERDEAVAARRVADNALALRQVAPAGDTWKAEAERHRANALRLSDALSELRESTEKRIAELESTLAELGAKYEGVPSQ